jgi:ribonuclease PH
MRSFGRSADMMRPVSFDIGFQKFATGSALIAFGETKVICSAILEDKVPGWMNGRGAGWLTAEYAMLPGSSQQRTQRDSGKGTNGRSQEIQRLIGRSLRAVTDLKALGERTLALDCDVLQADGGTRTASISGAYVAAVLACRKLMQKGTLKALPFREPVAALSVGIVKGEVFVDLDYAEDSSADVDMNLVMTASGKIIEIQGTAEGATFTETELQKMLSAAKEALKGIFAAQEAALSR